MSIKNEKLKGQKVIVVGGSSGMGKETVKSLLMSKANVIAVGRNQEKLDSLKNELNDPNLEIKSLDMMNIAKVEEFFNSFSANDVDHLIVSASTSVHGPFNETSIESVKGMFDSKFFGPYALAFYALPKLKEGASITFFSGVLSRRPGINTVGLGAVNSAVEGLTYGLALELGPNVRVNCVSPGMVRTEVYSGMPEDAREMMYKATGDSLPVKRVGRPDEIADAVLFLITNDYMTGKVLDIDGGHMIRQYAEH